MNIDYPGFWGTDSLCKFFYLEESNMKKMKRLVAVLLAGIMALAMLTACGGTPSTPSTPVTRDKELEKSVAAWTVELGKGAGLELTEDTTLTTISEKCLPGMVKSYNAFIANDQIAYKAAVAETKTAFNAAKNGRNVAPVDVLFLNMEVTKENLAAAIQQNAGKFQTILKNAGVENPAKFGVTVTKQDQYTLVLIMVSE